MKSATIFKKVVITGGCGYVGASLVPLLLSLGYEVSVVDPCVYGCHIQPHPKLEIHREDVRNLNLMHKLVENAYAVIHLAFAYSGREFLLNPQVAEEINLLAFQQLVRMCGLAGVSRIILSSSCSVYGRQPNNEIVTEETVPAPLDEYGSTKLESEKILLQETANFNGLHSTIVRYATVCGASSRQRFDLTFNGMVASAYFRKVIAVSNPDAIRPCVHIDDVIHLFLQILEEPTARVSGQLYNAAFENRCVLQSACLIGDLLGCQVHIKAANTDSGRTYNVSSNKLLRLMNFQPKRGLKDAVQQFVYYFEQGRWQDVFSGDQYYNMKGQNRFHFRQ